MLYYTKTVRQTLKELRTSEYGLATSDAEERLKLYGPNSIHVKGEPWWRKLLEPFANVFMAVLFIAVLVSVYHNDIFDAVIIGIIMATSAIIYYVQRFTTERILRSLQKHNSHQVNVLRNGKSTPINAEFLVPGDWVYLKEGDKVPADARLTAVESLRVDESQLTGESEPISKHIDALKGEKEVYDQRNMLFQGSFIVAGQASAVIVSTGNNTEFGQLASLTNEIDARSPVQTKIDRLLAQIIAIVAGIAVVAFVLSLARGIDIAESIRFVLALSVSAVPESLPVAISVILVLGMRRMAAKKALVRTMRSIESIGVITTIATDKTGTLTKNQLTIQDIWQPNNNQPAIFHEILAHTINARGATMYDPLDKAIQLYSEKVHTKLSKQPPLHTLPFHQSFAMSGNIWHSGNRYELAIKGAPEHILAKSDLTESEHEQATAQLHRFTTNGYRVIAIGHVILSKKITTFEDLPTRSKLHFDGFIAVADILRPEAKKAVQSALDAGVTVRIITGDHFETAYHIGRQLGLVSSRQQVFDSRHMSVMNDDDLEKIITSTRIFSRVTPEHKYRILTLLKKKNITAMTGDGVNDVPALTNAHVGVAMGSGASIAKDAGDIILLDDNFKSIIDAMKEGRAIFANIRRMLVYLLSTNAGEVLAIIAAMTMGLPSPLVPIQILWINLITDTSLVIPLGLEPGEATTMRQPPNKPNAPIIGKLLISRMVLMALTMAAVTLGVYLYFSHAFGHNYGQTIAFSTLVAMQWANALCSRSDHESLFRRLRVLNTPLLIGLTIAILLQGLAIFGPLSSLLHVTSVSIGDLFATAIFGFTALIALNEVHKWAGRHFQRYA